MYQRTQLTMVLAVPAGSSPHHRWLRSPQRYPPQLRNIVPEDTPSEWLQYPW